MAEEPVAGDRYRVRSVRRRGGLLRRARGGPSGRAVEIEDEDGTVVWRKAVRSDAEAEDLIGLIRRHVLTARLADFEAWLAARREEEGG
jgi:hypothetical protein